MLNRLKVLFLAFLVFCPPVLFAEGDAESLQISHLNEKWSEAAALLKARKMKEANQAMIELDTIRKKMGYTELTHISQELLGLSETFWASGDKENAKYTARKALELSENSPSFILEAAGCLTTFGIKTHLQLFIDFILAGVTRYDFMFPVLVSAIYPILWSLTFASIACSLLLFAANIHELLFKVRKALPKKGGTYTAPILLGLLLTVPLIGGPICTCIAYVLSVYIFLPANRVFGAFASTVIILWAVLIPVRENMNIWLNTSGVAHLLSVSSGIFRPDDLSNLSVLSKSRPNDQAAAFAYAKILKRSGNFAESEKVISPLRKEKGILTEIEAELGILKFLKNEIEGANSLYKGLEERNPDSAEILLNYSKIRFELLDTEESRWLFERANEANHSLAEKLRLNEEQFGIRSVASVAEFYLPVSYLMKSALRPDAGTQAAADSVASILVPHISLKYLGFVGLGLILVFLFVNDKKRDRRLGKKVITYKPVPSLDKIICIIPAGSDLVAGKAVKGFILMSFLVLITLPLLNWPGELRGLLTRMTGLELYYVFGYCFLISALSYIGFSSHEKETP